MSKDTMKLERVGGGLVELLDGIGDTVRERPFDCPTELARRLLADGTGRWRTPAETPPGRRPARGEGGDAP